MDEKVLFLIFFVFAGFLTYDVQCWWTSRRRRRRCSAQNCQVSGWTAWSSCTHSCGSSGTQRRQRHVTRTQSCGGGCFHLSESRNCNRVCCPVNCAWQWANWGTCQGCGRGTQSRSVVVSVNPSCGGTSCPTQTQSQSCDTGRCCPVNCAVSAWGSWGSCNAQCEKTGLRSRARRITTSPSCNGTPCPSLTTYRTCNGPCCRRDCTLSQWTAWGTCSAPAGSCSTNSGTHSRSRTVVRQQSCGGSCFSLQESKACTPVPRQCQVSQWGSWSSCTPKNGNCGVGRQSRTRTIVSQPYCAPACPTTTEARDCVHSCCPADCVLSQWSSWGTCSANCGQGSQVRRRQVSTPASCGGACSSVLSQTQQCTVIHKVDCQLSSWGGWSICSSGCGTGSQQRSRTITRQPTSCGVQCGSLSEMRQCQSYRDNRDCQVGGWTAWSSCSKNCSLGTQLRSRSVTQIKRCNGANCPRLQDSKSCGLSNGGCGQLCREFDATCYCLPGYELRNRTYCAKKDCGKPLVDYCPTGLANGTVCRQPWITCPNGATVYQTTCTVGCLSTYRLEGIASVSCEAEGSWTSGLSTTYCRRINDPPTDIVLSGSHSIPENSPVRTLVGSLSSVDVNSMDSHTYVLVSDRSSQGKFNIIGNKLYTLARFDYEADQKSYLLGITSSDNGNPPLSFTKYIMVRIVDVNEPPTDILISNSLIAENSDVGSVIAAFDTVDVDAGQKNIYRLLHSANGLFRINNNSLEVAKPNSGCLVTGSHRCPLNFEGMSTLQIEVESSDERTPSFNISRTFNITIADRNDPPYDITISKNSITETDPHGTIVGQLNAKDEDANPTQSISFALVDSDESRFAVSSDGVVTKAKDVDYETNQIHLIEVKATDNGSPPASNTRKLTIVVLDRNEPPVNISTVPLKPIVAENSQIGTVVCTIEAYDGDFITSLNLTLDDDAEGRFRIDDVISCANTSQIDAKTVCRGNLVVSGDLNFELSDSHEIIVRAEDRGHFIHRTIKIAVEDQNDPPEELTINGKRFEEVPENDLGAMVGKLLVVDEDKNQNHSCTLGDNYDLFELKDCQLRLASNISFDYETKKLYTLTVNVTDDGYPALSSLLKIDIRVTDVNEAPTDIQLSNNTVKENSKEGTAVASITVTDPDDTSLSAFTSYHSCRLMDSASGRFKIVGQLNLVVGAGILDFEQQSNHTIAISCSDSSLAVSKTFTINLMDINEMPTQTTLSNNKITENIQRRQSIGILRTVDPDNIAMHRQTFTYRIASNQSRFEISGNELYSKSAFDYEAEPVLFLEILATDDGSPRLTKSEILRIEVVDANDAPRDISISSNTVDENSAEGTTVGTLVTTDQDLSQRFTYHLANNADGRFKIENNILKVAASNVDCLKFGKSFCRLDFEKQPSHLIEVTTVDNGSPPLSFTKNITIILRNVNDRPRNLQLSNYTVPETAPINYVIGRFSVSDEDVGQSFTCSLSESDGGRFAVDSFCNLYKATNETDFETNRTHSITVKVSDNGNPSLEISKTFVIEVLDENEAPIRTIILSKGGQLQFPDDQPKVEENSMKDTIIGTVVSYDSEPVERLKFQLDESASGTFSLGKNVSCSNITGVAGARSMCSVQLMLSKEVNFETQPALDIILRTVDNGGLFHVKKFTVEIDDKNDAPTGITISGLKYVVVPENQPGTLIDEMVTTDEDRRQMHTYTLQGNNSHLFAIYKTYLFLSRGTYFDYENQTVHTITLNSTDSGQPPMSVVDKLELRVQDINEAPTDIFLDGNVVLENSQVGTIVANLTVSDPDNMGKRGKWQTHVCSVTSSSSGLLIITGEQLVVAQNGIDFEKSSTLNISIRCEDSGRPVQYLEKWFIIQVQDFNEKPTRISLSSNSIPENSPLGGIGVLETQDPDNANMMFSTAQTFTYYIMNNGSNLPFEISGSILKTSKMLDFENQTSWPLQIRSIDSGSPAMFVDADFFVNVTDVNEQPYDVTLNHSYVNENSAYGVMVGVLSTRDPDNGQSFTYSMVDDAGGLFLIDKNQVKVATDNANCLALGGNYCPINFEKLQSVDIRVKTEDDGTPKMTFEKTISIKIRDVNDKPRNIQLSGNHVPENATKGYKIGLLSAADEDKGQNLTFRLTDDDNGRFALSDDGYVIKAKETNYENTKTHKITVEVSDNGNPSLKISEEFVIIVQDVNEAPTRIEISSERGQLRFPKDSPRVNENSAIGTIVGTVTAYDEDAVERLKFSLDNDANGKFSVDSTLSCSNTSANGTSLHTVCRTLLRASGAVNYEAASSLSIIIRVTDNNGLYHSQLFSISIEDQNDRPYDILVNGLHTGFVNENEDNKLIGTLQTMDEDNGQLFSYRILNDDSVLFIISGGKLYTSPHASLNYEKKNNYSIRIETVDNGSPSMAFQTNLTIEVLDVNEAATSISLSSTTVKENSAIGTVIGNFSVTDPDNEGKFNGRQTSSCRVVVDTSAMFEVKNSLTLVTKKATLDYENRASYNLRVRCTDNGIPSQFVEEDLTVSVGDVNERPTSIILTSGSVAENLGPVTVGTLVVSDPDTTKQTFAINIMNRTVPFKTIGNLLQTTRSLNYEEVHVYRIQIKAIDQGGLSCIENFTIQVQDRNDAPSAIIFTGPLSLEENSPAGSLVATASAVDEDFYQTHIYRIDQIVGFGDRFSRSLPGYFTIGSISGRILSATSNIDHEEFKSLNITVTATDNGRPSLSVVRTVTVHVRDVNHPPTDIRFSGQYVIENSAVGTIIGNFTVIDPDNKYREKQTFTCFFTNVARDALPFAIKNKIMLIVNGDVNYETKQTYSLEVTCRENHVLPYNITKTFILPVRNINEAPIINITSSKVAENLNAGAIVGNVYAMDPDNELTTTDNVTIELLPVLDSSAFRLVGGASLITNQRFDYEQKNIFNVKIRATDNGSPALSTEQILHIMVEDINDRPTDITLSSTTVAENSQKGIIVGTLGAIDEDAGQTHSYSLVNTIDSLAIHGQHLVVFGKLDFETEPMISIIVNVTDSGVPAFSYEKSFNISVTDSNDAPSDIEVTLYPVMENNTVDMKVTDLKVIDEDDDQGVRSCSVINNPGYFFFSNGPTSDTMTMFIRGNAPLDYESAPLLNATVQCFDNGSPALSVQKKISIQILDSNDMPTAIMINGSNHVFLAENSPPEAVVGQLTCIDQDRSQSHTYALQSSNDIFMINENSDILRVRNASQLDYEKLPSSKSLSVSITVSDDGQPSLSFTEAIQVRIVDINEAPTNIRMLQLSGSKVPENVTTGTHIGELFADNPEGFRQQLTFQLLNWRETFEVTETHGPGKVSYLTVKGELDFDMVTEYNVSVSVTDNGVPPLSARSIVIIGISRSDPCFTGSLDCGTEICQRINKTRGNCGCLAGFEPKDSACRQIDDCKANCQFCDDPKKACQAKRTCLPCGNNATCVDKLMSFNCICVPGFTDERCQTNIDDCANKPCRHGECFDLINNYSCECDDGYEGRNCQVNTNECRKRECVKGDCTDLIAGFSCSCLDGVWGLLCNRLEKDCTPSRCGSKRCVPPGYKDLLSLEKGGEEVFCANEDQVVTLTFAVSSVPDVQPQQNKWKYIFRDFVTKMVGIPFYAVDLDEDASNGGFFYPTDVVMYPFKSGKTKRDLAQRSESLVFPMVVKVKNKLVPQDSFLRAVNKTCANIKESSKYWVYCNATYVRIKELGITTDTRKNTKEKSVGGFKIYEGNNIYILVGGGAALILFAALLLMMRSRRRRARERAEDATHFAVEGGESYYDAMERHIARRVDSDGVPNPMYGADDNEVSHSHRMFDNPLYGVNGADDDHEIEDVISNEVGLSNPLYNKVQFYGDDIKHEKATNDSDC